MAAPETKPQLEKGGPGGPKDIGTMSPRQPNKEYPTIRMRRRPSWFFYLLVGLALAAAYYLTH